MAKLEGNEIYLIKKVAPFSIPRSRALPEQVGVVWCCVWWCFYLQIHVLIFFFHLFLGKKSGGKICEIID